MLGALLVDGLRVVVLDGCRRRTRRTRVPCVEVVQLLGLPVGICRIQLVMGVVVHDLQQQQRHRESYQSATYQGIALTKSPRAKLCSI